MAVATGQLPIFTRLETARIRELRRRDEFLWVDLCAPGSADVEQLGALFGFHPLALDDTRGFGRRPRLDEYGDHLVLVFYAARLDTRAEPEPVEVHVFVSGGCVVTLHREPCAELAELHRDLRERSPRSEQWVVYRILDALTNSFFAVLDAIDEELDGLEETIIAAPTDEQLARIFRLKRAMAGLRRVVAPARDLFQSAPDQIAALPGLESDTHDYFRNVYDHLLRASELIDSYRDVLTSAMDVYLSTTSNRLNVIVQRLTLIATIFLPLTFITGFFGQNFGWLVDHIDGPLAFAGLGIGSLLLSSIAVLLLFRRAGYLRS